MCTSASVFLRETTASLAESSAQVPTTVRLLSCWLSVARSTRAIANSYGGADTLDAGQWSSGLCFTKIPWALCNAIKNNCVFAPLTSMSLPVRG